MNINIKIKKLSAELTNDFIGAFDSPAFFSNPNLSFGCYCTWYYWTEELETERNKCDDVLKNLLRGILR